MAQIYQAINTRKVIEDFGLKNFVETGTGIADSIGSVVDLGLDIQIYSIEVQEQLFNANQKRLKGAKNLHLKLGYTHDRLPEILTELEGPTLFFHDAHFPGADFGFTSYDSEKNDAKRLPLETELRLVKSMRDTSKDVFAIDDLRIYMDGPFEGGNWSDRHIAGGDNVDFVYELFGETHKIIESYVQQGFLILFPNNYGPGEKFLGEYVIGDHYIIH